MNFHVLTLFPEMILEGCNNSILKRAIEKELLTVDAVNIRDFTLEKHGKVDDYTYGGGAGMLMQAQPVYDAWLHVTGNTDGNNINDNAAVANDVMKADGASEQKKKPRTIYMTPQGRVFTQEVAKELAKEEDLIILCGHYEGIDERVLDEIVTDRISIGDYVLTGGELPALVMIDAISRLVPGVLGSEESAQTESFENDLLEYPQYSRPEVWHGKAVPEVLLTGDHKKIEAWRREAAKERTKIWRPDLYEKYAEKEQTIKRLMKQKKENAYLIDSLLKGKAKLLHTMGNAAVALGINGITYMICCETKEEGEALLAYVPKDAKVVLHNCAELNDLIDERYNLQVGDECYQSVYTQHTAMPIAHKDIRPYPISEIDYAVENYGGEQEREYLRDRILKGEFFAAYENDEIAGFCGVHAGGSLGLLYVDPKYRRTSIGSSLASYLVNWSLERGGLPYAHIRVKNIASLKMQEKMGLYVGKRTIFWTYRKEKEEE
ncbi:MAG: tRNA (guanosine(37)-N1)-methyltransferase TrmD [Lachnospiraceae bacterium]|nr:tRNA (guanosine(37)-N1)-methyltransferase TrmD [Lachnospiraceae bacterium]